VRSKKGEGRSKKGLGIRGEVAGFRCQVSGGRCQVSGFRCQGKRKDRPSGEERSVIWGWVAISDKCSVDSGWS